MDASAEPGSISHVCDAAGAEVAGPKMSEKTTDQARAGQRRGNAITLTLLLVWVAVIFTNSILKFAKVIS